MKLLYTIFVMLLTAIFITLIIAGCSRTDNTENGDEPDVSPSPASDSSPTPELNTSTPEEPEDNLSSLATTPARDPAIAYITFDGPTIDDVTADGMRVSPFGDGDSADPEMVQIDDEWVLSQVENAYIYLFVDKPELKEASDVMLEITYYDDASDSFFIEYCSDYNGDWYNELYHNAGGVFKNGSNTYKTAYIPLDKCNFKKTNDGGGQFRIVHNAIIKSIKLIELFVIPISEPEWTVITPSDPTQGTFVAAYDASKYGVSPDISDNTHQLQNLINKIHSIGGGTLYVPKGIYRIDGPLTVKQGVTIRGDWTEPVKGQPFDVENNTLFATNYGWGSNDIDTGFINMSSKSAVVNISVWYPDQDPDAIVPYAPAIMLGTHMAWDNDSCNVKNVTLINPYIGIQYQYAAPGLGACLSINGVYGAPLKLGVEIDALADIGRVEQLCFSPEYWSESGLLDSPEKGGSFEDFMYDNGVGLSMRRNDWHYTGFLDIEGYNIGFHTLKSNFYEDLNLDAVSPNGHDYDFSFANCKTGIYNESSDGIGIMLTKIKIVNCETGICVASDNDRAVMQLTDAYIDATEYAIHMEAGHLLMNQGTVERGLVYVNGGIFSVTATVFDNATPQISFGLNGRGILVGNIFKEPFQVDDSSKLTHIVENGIEKALLDETVHDFPSGNPVVKMPAKNDLYVVTQAPYITVFTPFVDTYTPTDTENMPDSTKAIQDALNDAGSNGGGIVFLPPGKYRVNGNLRIPTGVELRGADGEISAIPKGTGSILEVYGGRDDLNGAPFIVMEENSGLRGIVINYPEQKLTSTQGDGISPYPYTIQGRGKDIYIVNVGLRAGWNGVDLSTYRCDNAYIDAFNGHAFRTAVLIGGGSRDIDVRNIHFNPGSYSDGYEQRWGCWPNSQQFAAEYATMDDRSFIDTSVAGNLKLYSEFMVIGDCENLLLYNNFSYGAHIGTRFINQTTGGSQNLHVLGHGIDAASHAVYFDSGLTGKLVFVNTQLVSFAYKWEDIADTCYIYAAANSSFRSNFYGIDCWGRPGTSYIMNSNTGTLGLQAVNVEYGVGENRFVMLQGEELNIINARFNKDSSQYSSVAIEGDLSQLSVISSIFNGFNNLNLSSAKHNIGNLITE